MQRRCTEQLKSEHQLILQALEVLRQMTKRLEASEDVKRADLLDVIRFFRIFVHEYHDAKEQWILLPALAERGLSLDKEPLRTIVSDHEQVHAAIDNLEAALDEWNQGSIVKLSFHYIDLLTTHIFNEDHLLFTTMNEALSQGQDQDLVQRFQAFEPALREYAQSQFEHVVRFLDRKYSSPECI
jgi:hemerythrin-like domain-containing protein